MNASITNQFRTYIEGIDFFGMVDRFWASHEKDGVVEAEPWSAIVQNLSVYSEEELRFVANHFLSEMRKEYPHSILVCHL